MVLYNPNIIFASQTSNRQELTPTQLEQGYVRQSQISSSEQNGSEYLKSLGLSQLYLIGDQYQSVIKYRYGMSCSIVYAASATNVYIRRFVVKNESAWQTPITDTPPLKNASVTTEGDISFWSGGTLDEENWQETTQNVDGVTVVQRNGVLSVAGEYQRAIGELLLGLWDIGEQPWGFYPLLGDTYPLTSAVAQQVQNHAPASIRRLFRVEGTTMTFPDFSTPNTEDNQYGFYPRFAHIAGQKHADTFQYHQHNVYNSNYSVRGQERGSFNGHQVVNSYGYLKDPDQPTASDPRAGTETAPITLTFIPYMYLGVDYEPPAGDPQDEYIAGKMITKLGYLQPYTGSEQVGYLNKYFTVQSGMTYCINPPRDGDPQQQPVVPLPQAVLNKYGFGGEYDSEYRFIRPITVDVIKNVNNTSFYSFTLSDTTAYIRLNVAEEQLETYRIVSATNLWIEPLVQDSGRWMKTNQTSKIGVSYFIYKVNMIRYHTSNTGYTISNLNIGYYNLWQEFLNRYSAATLEQFSLFNIWVNDVDKTIAVFYELGTTNIYNYTPTPPHQSSVRGYRNNKA